MSAYPDISSNHRALVARAGIAGLAAAAGLHRLGCEVHPVDRPLAACSGTTDRCPLDPDQAGGPGRRSCHAVTSDVAHLAAKFQDR